jgi:membrane peptidoglycan carboxypeptidase
VARLHPLELWLVGHLRRHPEAALSEVFTASREERQDVYAWLFRTRNKNAQDVRIRSLLEVEAFLEVQRAWRRLGYPFESLTPSYATSIGASGDRPAALAELMGIILNGGMRLPVTRIDSLVFARDTPYETRLVRKPPAAERVLPEELATIVRDALFEVVENGTARRLRGVLKLSDGQTVPIGGKTGTGDHRFDVYGRGGRLISSRVVNRTATFVFLIGDRYFGTMMAYVREPYAADYRFTSALPTQLMKSLVPTLLPMLEHGSCRG